MIHLHHYILSCLACETISAKYIHVISVTFIHNIHRIYIYREINSMFSCVNKYNNATGCDDETRKWKYFGLKIR